MGVEAATYIGTLNSSWPDGATDPKSQGDNHLRLIKAVLQATFPYANLAAVTFHRSATEPVVKGPAMIWVDITDITAVVWKYRGTSAWITLPFIFNETAATLGYSHISVDAGAGVGPVHELYRNSATPANDDELGGFSFYGKNNAAGTPEKILYAQIAGQIKDITDGSEDGQINFKTMVAGTSATRLAIGQGAVLGSATGGDKGTGSLNLEAPYVNGVRQKAVIDVRDIATAAYSYDGFPSWANGIEFEFDVTPVSDSVTLGVTLRKGAGVDITAYNVVSLYGNGTTPASGNAGGLLEIGLGTGRTTSNTGGISGFMRIFNIRKSWYKRVQTQISINDGGATYFLNYTHFIQDTAVLTGIRQSWSTGLTANGHYVLTAVP